MTAAEVARSHELPWLQLDSYELQAEALKLVPYETARSLQVLPLFREGQRLALGVVRPDDLPAQDYVRRLTGLDVEPVLVESEALHEALELNYVAAGRSGQAWARRAARELAESRPESQQRLSQSSDSPVARLLEHLLAQALQLRATDLHLEPDPEGPRLRYRIDGILHEYPAPPPSVYPALISRLKILANLDISEKRRPQDGRISLQLDEEACYELRVSTIPFLDGEGAAVRILGAGAGLLRLEELGLEADVLRRYRRVLRQPHGLVLVTGPTGAGKTTTLYATLAELAGPRRKTITLEDPIEYRLRHVCQIALRPELNFTFADGLRSALRHDPDVLMVGEIRDGESAEIAVRASFTGHLVFATLHTNTAVGALTRLTDMGVAPYKILSSLLWVKNQRLVRRFCPHCRTRQDGGLWAAPGCPRCAGLGYWGRVALYETLEITEEMRELACAERLVADILALAGREFLAPMQRSARQLLNRGETSPEELAAILGDPEESR